MIFKARVHMARYWEREWEGIPSQLMMCAFPAIRYARVLFSTRKRYVASSALYSAVEGFWLPGKALTCIRSVCNKQTKRLEGLIFLPVLGTKLLEEDGRTSFNDASCRRQVAHRARAGDAAQGGVCQTNMYILDHAPIKLLTMPHGFWGDQGYFRCTGTASGWGYGSLARSCKLSAANDKAVQRLHDMAY